MLYLVLQVTEFYQLFSFSSQQKKRKSIKKKRKENLHIRTAEPVDCSCKKPKQDHVGNNKLPRFDISVR